MCKALLFFLRKRFWVYPHMYRHFPHFMALTHVSSSVLRLHGREFCFVERNLEGVVSDKNIVLFFWVAQNGRAKQSRESNKKQRDELTNNDING